MNFEKFLITAKVAKRNFWPNSLRCYWENFIMVRKGVDNRFGGGYIY